MAKTLRTSGDYTVKAGAGYDSGSGTNTIRLDARYVRIPGDLTVEGTQTVIDSQTLSVEDQFIEVNRNNSTAGTEDSGILFNQGSSTNQILYYDADQSEFVIGSTTHNATVSAITNITPGNIRIAEPAQSDHAATKSYVDSAVTVSASGFSFKVTADDSTVVPVVSGNTLAFIGGANIETQSAEPDTITISLAQDLTNIETISSASSNGSITLTANGTGSIIIDEILTFNTNQVSDPSATGVTKLYAKTPSGGGTGVFFVNSAVSSGSADELISKKKATALAIALG
jgi:hypothetical protein